MTSETTGSAGTRAMRELEAGVAVWLKQGWPRDFHNGLYKRLATLDPNGDFTLDWWNQVYPTLRAWRATRPYPRVTLTSRFTGSVAAIGTAWRTGCAAYVDQTIETVAWEQVGVFADAVGRIKPTRSPVFRSKLCHFVLPAIFPVVDRGVLGRWAALSYGDYFTSVRDEWCATAHDVRADLRAYLEEQLKTTGAPVYDGFPWACKIVEVRRIGRRRIRNDALN